MNRMLGIPEVECLLEGEMKRKGIVHIDRRDAMTGGGRNEPVNTTISIQGYRGLRHPMEKRNDGKLMPNFNFRYLTEDLPMGQLVTRGVAELCGVETPKMDEVIKFGEKAMGVQWLKEGKLAGKDVSGTRSPQAYGINTIEDLLTKQNYAQNK
jgi:hypothetical protein